MADEKKMTKKEVIRYATEQLHAVRPQPAGIPEMLEALKNSLDTAEEEAVAEKEEAPPKDVAEAISRIDAAVGKMEHPPKEKADLKSMVKEEKNDKPAKTEATKGAAKPAHAGV